MTSVRCVVVGALLHLIAPVGAVRSSSDDSSDELEMNAAEGGAGTSRTKICKASEREGVPQFGVTFAFEPPGGCWIGNCRTPSAVFAEYIYPDVERQQKAGVKGLIRAKLQASKCKCFYSDSLNGEKEYKLTWFAARNEEGCTPAKCWEDFAHRRFKPQFYKGELTNVSSDDHLTSGNHWNLECEPAEVTEPYIEMPGLDRAKQLEEEEMQSRLEEQENARRERERIAEAERLERLRIAEEERIAEEKRIAEESELEAEKERLRREAEEQRLEEERRREAERVEQDQRRIQDEADRALALAATAKGITIAEGSWKITLLWGTDNVDLDLHFYKKDWVAGKSAWRARNAEIYYGHKEVTPFVLDLDDLGGTSERRGRYHVENVNLEASVVPDGEYVAYVELYSDRRYGQRGPIQFQLILKGVGGESGALACKPKTASEVLACSFDAPDVTGSSVNQRHDLPEFDFTVTDGHLKFKIEQL